MRRLRASRSRLSTARWRKAHAARPSRTRVFRPSLGTRPRNCKSPSVCSRRPSPFKPDQIEIGRHGLLVSLGHYRGLLLPQVPVEHGWDRITFLEQTCRKAGLPPNAWQTGAKLEAFTAEVFADPMSECPLVWSRATSCPAILFNCSRHKKIREAEASLKQFLDEENYC